MARARRHTELELGFFPRRRAFYDKRLAQEVDGEALGDVRPAARALTHHCLRTQPCACRLLTHILQSGCCSAQRLKDIRCYYLVEARLCYFMELTADVLAVPLLVWRIAVKNTDVLVARQMQEFKGYVFKITGGQDKQGFPMKQVRAGSIHWVGWRADIAATPVHLAARSG